MLVFSNNTISNLDIVALIIDLCGFDILKAMVMKSSIFWNIMLCSPLTANILGKHVSIFRIMNKQKLAFLLVSYTACSLIMKM
jgi:hypothetical protein